MLKIYNSLTKQKEVFVPIDEKNVRMYVCGMTVYDYCHLGHGRLLVVFDMVNRYLRYIFGTGHVHYVRNITDIDDKIIARAKENGEELDNLTHRFITAMDKDTNALLVLKPDEEPRATHHMDEIINMIDKLLSSGYAYVGKNNDVYYAVHRFESYGKLSGKKLDELRSGARVEVNEAKRDPLDFVLWKSAKEGEPSWSSAWGPGRPGWHIECSAMSTQCLGDHFDIHGGGMDLQFPHHENEIAQSEAATNKTFVNVWMHNGFVRVDREKMSKSLGNFFTIRDIINQFDPEVVRFFLLSSHYRSPLNYSDRQLEKAKAALSALYNSLNELDTSFSVIPSSYSTRFHEAMEDDFHTPSAIAILHELAREINRFKLEDMKKANELGAELRDLGGILGLLGRDTKLFFHAASGSDRQVLSDVEILDYIQQRNDARAEKDFNKADRIRELLKSKGIQLEDKDGKTNWRIE